MAISNADLAQKISDLIDFWSTLTVEYKNWLGGSVGGGPNSDGKYPLTDFTGNESLVESPAQLSDDVGGFVDQAETAETNAAASATAAQSSEDDATTEAGIATQARIDAESARTTAQNEATAALNSSVTAVTQANLATDRAGYAEEWANLPFETLISAAAGGDQVDDYSALHWSVVAAAFAGDIDSNLYGQLAQAEAVTGPWTFANTIEWLSGHRLRLSGVTAANKVTFRHDNTDFELVALNTTDFNITGFTAIAAGTVNADFAALTAASFGGITEANLLDKTAPETITQEWIHTRPAGNTAVFLRSTAAGNITGPSMRWQDSAEVNIAAMRGSMVAGVATLELGTGWFQPKLTLKASGVHELLGALAIDGALSATSYGGIAESDLLDKNDAEAITGPWSFTNASQVVRRTVPAVFSTAGAGWYRVAKATGSAGRGGFDIHIYTTGSALEPNLLRIIGFKDWSVTGYFQSIYSVKNLWWDGVRIVDDTATGDTYIEVQFKSAISSTSLIWTQDSSFIDKFVPLTGALTIHDGANTVRLTQILTANAFHVANLIAGSVNGISSGDLLDKTAAETITANLIIDVETGGPHLHVKGGSVGNNIAKFERDVGSTGSIAMHAAGGNPAIRWDRSTFIWYAGVNASDEFVIGDGSSVGTADKLTVSAAGNLSAASFGGITEANLLDKTAPETITGLWIHDAELRVQDAAVPKIALYQGGTERLFLSYTVATITARLDSDGPIVLAPNNSAALTLSSSQNAVFAGTVSAVSYGGILEANLLDKSAAETVPGKYIFSHAAGLDVGSAADNISPGAASPGQLRILGLGYTGYAALDATGMHFGHNSSSRILTFDTNEITRMTITGAGAVSVAGALTAASYGGITEANLLDKSAVETISAGWNFAAITADSYDGILSGNLLDKTAIETVTGAWTFKAGANSASILTIGESSTLRGDAQDGYLQMYGEASSVIYGGRLRIVAGRFELTGLGSNPVTSLWLTSLDLDLLGGKILRIRDASNVDNATFSHDGTDFNTTFANTTDWNITVANLKLVGALTATSYGGITEANLLDKTATETISGAWTFTGFKYTFSGSAPNLIWEETDASANNTKWRMQANSEAFKLQVLDDAESAGVDIFKVQRSNNVVDSFTVSAPLLATSYDGVLAANLLDKTAAEIITGLGWHFDDNGAGGTPVTFTGGGGGVDIVRFMRDIGTTADVSISSSGGDPQIRFTNVVQWAFGLDVSADAMVFTDGGTVGATYAMKIAAGGVVDITGALTAVSYGGITEANLLDKTAAETITGDWTLGGTTLTLSPSGNVNVSSALQILSGRALVVFAAGNVDKATFSHDGTDFNTALVNTTDWNITGAAVNFGSAPLKSALGIPYHVSTGYVGGKVTVASTAPSSPTKGDLWFDNS